MLNMLNMLAEGYIRDSVSHTSGRLFVANANSTSYLLGLHALHNRDPYLLRLHLRIPHWIRLRPYDTYSHSIPHRSSHTVTRVRLDRPGTVQQISVPVTPWLPLLVSAECK